MRRVKKFLSFALSLSMALTLCMPVAEAGAKVREASRRSAEEPGDASIAVLELNAAESEESLGQENDTTIPVLQERTGISLEEGDSVVSLRALDGNGEVLRAGKDYTIKSCEGNKLERMAAGAGVIVHGNVGIQDELKVLDASGKEVMDIVLVNKPEGINADDTAPRITDITVTPTSVDAALEMGVDGSLTLYGKKQKYYRFDLTKIKMLYNVTITYDDGTQYTANLNQAVTDGKVKASHNQSYNSPWVEGGTANTLYVVGGSIEKSINVPVKGRFDELFEDCGELELDKTTQVSYLSSKPKNGSFRFRPENDGIYYFYSSGDTDALIWMFDEYGKSVAYDDDGYDEHNFIVSADLKAGKTYVIQTQVYGNQSGSYEITGARKAPEDFGYASLKGMDLTGKYINVALIVDTTGSMQSIIDSVRDGLTKFVDEIAATNARLRISLIDYKDIDMDGKDTTILHYSPALSIWFENEDVEALKAEIDKLGATGGGDSPESAVDALANLIEPDVMTFNSAAAKFAFLVTDATYKDDNTHELENMKELMHKLVEKGVVTSVITEKENYSFYQKLTTVTEGILINVQSNFLHAMGRLAARIAEETEEYEADPDITPVQGIELGDDLTVPEGKIKNFRPIFDPADASEQGVVWMVEDQEIAGVSPITTDGILVVRGIKEGTTKIIARSLDGGYVASFDLTIQKAVVTDNKMESCDIDSILEELEKSEVPGVETPVTDLIYYGDSEPKVEADKQKVIYSHIIRTEKSISYVFDDEYGDLLYQWKFEGENISDSDIAVDLGAAIDSETSSVEQAAIEREGLDPYTVIEFFHSGTLPGRAAVSVKVGEKFADGTYELYYYNKDTGKLELCEDTVVKVSGGIAQFEISHCSSYVIGKKELLPAPTPFVTPVPEPTPVIVPTSIPTPSDPTAHPTLAPTHDPEDEPTQTPPSASTMAPTDPPTQTPTDAPSGKPTDAPAATIIPIDVPTPKPLDPPTLNPSAAPTDPPLPTDNVPAKGTRIFDKKAVYTVSKAGMSGGTVTYTKPVKRNVTSVSIPNTVRINGITYKVTAIAANAFKNCKKLKKITIGKNIASIGAKAFYKCNRLAKITVKTKNLTGKKVGSRAFQGIYKKAVMKVPKNKRKAYKKLLRARGCGNKVKFK